MSAQLIPPKYLLPIVPFREFRSQDPSAHPPPSDSDHQIKPLEIDINVSFTSASQQPSSRGQRSLNHGGRISELSTFVRLPNLVSCESFVLYSLRPLYCLLSARSSGREPRPIMTLSL